MCYVVSLHDSFKLVIMIWHIMYYVVIGHTDLFMEYCIFLGGAGHFEKAIALFQAQIEFSLCRPSILGQDATHKDAVDFMSVFWDSSAPKFGETAAAGWSAWVENGGVHSSSSFWYSKGEYFTL